MTQASDGSTDPGTTTSPDVATSEVPTRGPRGHRRRPTGP